MSEQQMTVEIDEAIRRDPELLRDVEAATEYLRRLPEEIPTLRLPDAVRWRPGDAAGSVELMLSEVGPPKVADRRQIGPGSLSTGQYRGLSILRSVSNFLAARSAARPPIEVTLMQLLQNLEANDAAQVEH